MQGPIQISVFKEQWDRVCLGTAMNYNEKHSYISPSLGDHGGAGSEDCLKINVYTPVGVKKGAKREYFPFILA